MHSPTENEKPSKPPPEKTVKEMLDEALHSLVLELMQMRRILWLAAQANGGTLTVDETKCDPLWRLGKSRDPLNKHLLVLKSDTMPVPTPAQIDQLVERLGGSMSDIGEAVAGTPLQDYNHAYLTILIRNRLVRDERGYWIQPTASPC